MPASASLPYELVTTPPAPTTALMCLKKAIVCSTRSYGSSSTTLVRPGSVRCRRTGEPPG